MKNILVGRRGGGGWAKHVGDREEWKKERGWDWDWDSLSCFSPPPPLFAPARQAKRVSDVNPLA